MESTISPPPPPTVLSSITRIYLISLTFSSPIVISVNLSEPHCVPEEQKIEKIFPLNF
jgi:hypothetical protein